MGVNMKHIVLVIAALMLAGCDNRQLGDPRVSRTGVAVVKDAWTGCEYVKHGDGGLTPRIDRDGKTHRGCGL